MENEQVVKAIVELAQDADGPSELDVEHVDDAIVEAAMEVFDGWSTALAAALVEIAASAKTSRRSRQEAGPADVERNLTAAFEHPVYVETTDDTLFELPGPEVDVGTPQILGGDVVGIVRRLHYVGDSDAMFLFSNQGRFFGLDRRQIPRWDGRGELRSIRDTLYLSTDESICAVVPRREMITGRVVHVTRGGKAKATDASEYGRELDRSGRQGFKIRDGDEPVAVMGIGRETTLFCASAKGRGIHFEADELRSMGRKAIGVNAMKLEGEDDEIVGAFDGKRVRQLAVITARGLGKRVDFDEFRTQGRNGKGMQLARLNPGDAIAGVVACNPAEDVAVTSNRGRVWRLPAGSLYAMGRSAKGNRMVELDDDERVVDLEALPCGSE